MSQHGLSEKVADLLRCPVTQQALHPCSDEELAKLKAELPEGAYITEDGRRAYPVEDGFPILVPASAIQLED